MTRAENDILVALRELQRRKVRPCDFALFVIATRTRWAKISTLAALAGMSEPSAHRAVRRLRIAGVFVGDYRDRTAA